MMMSQEVGVVPGSQFSSNHKSPPRKRLNFFKKQTTGIRASMELFKQLEQPDAGKNNAKKGKNG